MPNTKLLFSFNDLSVKDKAAKAAIKYFTRAGVQVADQDVSTQIKRTSGISYREMKLTFADSQTLIFRIKQSGDIYQVLLNGKLTPIKNQDDHVAAISEIVHMLDVGRTKFQAKLAKAIVKLPPSIRTAAPKMLAVLTEKRDGLKEAIAAVREEITKIRAPLLSNSSNNLTQSGKESTISPEVNQTAEAEMDLGIFEKLPSSTSLKNEFEEIELKDVIDKYIELREVDRFKAIDFIKNIENEKGFNTEQKYDLSALIDSEYGAFLAKKTDQDKIHNQLLNNEQSKKISNALDELATRKAKKINERYNGDNQAYFNNLMPTLLNQVKNVKYENGVVSGDQSQIDFLIKLISAE
jgi:hypothetical protein